MQSSITLEGRVPRYSMGFCLSVFLCWELTDSQPLNLYPGGEFVLLTPVEVDPSEAESRANISTASPLEEVSGPEHIPAVCANLLCDHKQKHNVGCSGTNNVQCWSETRLWQMCCLYLLHSWHFQEEVWPRRRLCFLIDISSRIHFNQCRWRERQDQKRLKWTVQSNRLIEQHINLLNTMGYDSQWAFRVPSLNNYFKCRIN